LKQRIGIIGGGQLGKMMILAAKYLGFYVTVLDPDAACPAHSICDEQIVAPLDDVAANIELSNKSDILTYEFEDINADILEKLESEGAVVYPTPKSLKIIQNKYLQKYTLKQNGVPVPKLKKINSYDELADFCGENNNSAILKTSFGGYDGKGNAVIKSLSDARAAYDNFAKTSGEMFAEELVDFKTEISVLTCRGTDNRVAIYPIAENRHEDNILRETRVPARISKNAIRDAMAIAGRTIEVFEGVGMFCAEMFVTNEDKILVNEVAPRPHNSGHYTIEACACSQFEQHIRAISGLPLGETSMYGCAVMRNILGSPGYSGKPLVVGAELAMALPGVHLHVYGKSSTRPKRKMGHITVVNDDMDKTINIADQAAGLVKIISE